MQGSGTVVADFGGNLVATGYYRCTGTYSGPLTFRFIRESDGSSIGMIIYAPESAVMPCSDGTTANFDPFLSGCCDPLLSEGEGGGVESPAGTFRWTRSVQEQYRSSEHELTLTAGSGSEPPPETGCDDGAPITGTSGPDDLVGTTLGETISGNSGDDSILGMAGDDCLLGGDGNDALDGKEGRDTVDGGPGNDRVIGGKDKDILLGGEGNDLFSDGLGANRYDGGPGTDYLFTRQSIPEKLQCGPDEDFAFVDAKDKLGRKAGCERTFEFTPSKLPTLKAKTAEPALGEEPAADNPERPWPSTGASRVPEYYSRASCKADGSACYVMYSFPVAVQLYQAMEWADSAEDNVSAVIKACKKSNILKLAIKCSKVGIGAVVLSNVFQAAVKGALKRIIDDYEGCWLELRYTNIVGKLKVRSDPSDSGVLRGKVATFYGKPTGLVCSPYGYVRGPVAEPEFPFTALRK